ncbi:MAG TPA: HAMP domain-containing sensor histidine kinase [Anaerolineae bacterium]|nr:HAMP domain-containing sensor histidine kinase [Anaerolineae bacterium]
MPSQCILVVEDDIAMAGGISDVLELAGYDVRVAHHGREALTLIIERQPDLIVSDIMMPEMDGYDLFNQVRANPNWLSIPFIFLTAKGQKSDIRLGKTMGAEDYLVKPFDWEDLLVAVRARLARAQALKAVSLSELATLKNRILNTLSHEFRTPLTYITGYSDLLQEQDLSPEQLQQFLKRLQSGSARLSRLVEDFLFLVALEAGEAQTAYAFQRDHFSEWAALVQRALARYAEKAAAHKVTLTSEVTADLPAMVIHAGYIEDALSRLLDNAIKFMLGKPGYVHVSAAPRDGGVLICVSDEGIGIAEADLPQVFEPFQQIDRETHEQQGSGVGLAIVKGVVELHGGRVEATSRVGQGSTFCIWLPRLEDEP